jgi:gluconolactonase
VPRAGGADFDDTKWEMLDPSTLDRRRGRGRLSFNWYRIKITIPERIGSFDTRGATAVFETSVDDYAEVWIDGELPRMPGQSGGAVVKGWNAANRLIAGRNVKPGQEIQIAVFGMNGPISNPVTNYIWMRNARLEFYPASAVPLAITPREVNVEVIWKDASLDAIVPANPKLFKLAEGFEFTEGPVWVRNGGYLLFSDPNSNTIYRYRPDGQLSVFRRPSGYGGEDVDQYRQPGSNGLTIDPAGFLVINEHGNRRVVQIGRDNTVMVIADRFDGKRLNSPNDLVYRSDGTLFFTDPPFGLPRVFADPGKELPFSGVFAQRNGTLQLISKELSGPNGIALSPDERYLYVGNWDEKRKVIMRYDLGANGDTPKGRVFFDMTDAPGEDAIDGIKVDRHGNLYVSGPRGLWILSSAGKHLGTIVAPRHIHNLAWGDEDGQTLYMCARDALFRMRLCVVGVRP